MGLDIGVASIDYLERPAGKTYDFLSYLNANSEQAEWLTGSEGSTFIEITTDTMDEQLQAFQSANKVSPSQVQDIRRWIASLPWKNNVVMLHLSW